MIFGVVFVCGSIFPHLWHIKNYIIPPILENSEAKALQEIPAKYGDYALAWWDYGYFVRYFARLNTFVDGGIHSGKQNYPISFVLSAKTKSKVTIWQSSLLITLNLKILLKVISIHKAKL